MCFDGKNNHLKRYKRKNSNNNKKNTERIKN